MNLTTITRRRFRPPSALWTMCWLALAALITVGIDGCGAGSVRAGSAFKYLYATSIGAKPIRPGFELGLLYVLLENTSGTTLVVNSVGISGPGIGTTVRPVQVEIAPLRFGLHQGEPNWAPGGLYQVNPPAFFAGGICRRQALFPVPGYRMAPGSLARILVIVRAVRPGRWAIPVHVVNYTIQGVPYRQAMQIRAWGSVSDDAAYIAPYWAQAKCVNAATGATFLPGYHAGKVSY
jgi:hypothetical protein